MNVDYLDRAEAPFGPDVWAKLDETVVGAASSQLTGRRLLEIEGPHGLGLKSIAGPDEDLIGDVESTVCLSPVTPVPTIKHSFTLPMRDVANYETTGVLFNVRAVATAAIQVARREDDIIFNGIPDHGIPGLLNISDAATINLNPWTEPGMAFENIMEAVNVLDDRGLHGPYALALSPPLYNALFRLYPNGGPAELEQVRMMVTGGIIKSPSIANGGVLVAVGKQFLSLVIGQDLVTAYVGPQCGEFEFCLMESLVLKVALPQAVCAITG
ncbi:MAG: family 1 encapsulin nanocompartment shell protein [Armatimonadia bacterium]